MLATMRRETTGLKRGRLLCAPWRAARWQTDCDVGCCRSARREHSGHPASRAHKTIACRVRHATARRPERARAFWAGSQLSRALPSRGWCWAHHCCARRSLSAALAEASRMQRAPAVEAMWERRAAQRAAVVRRRAGRRPAASRRLVRQSFAEGAALKQYPARGGYRQRAAACCQAASQAASENACRIWSKPRAARVANGCRMARPRGRELNSRFSGFQAGG